MSDQLTCDYLVVGAGSAGCAVAARLSENSSSKVILLEAGGPDSDPTLHIPGAIVRNVSNPRFNWGYTTVPQSQLQNRELFWPRGRVLGGSSSINGMIYIRGDKHDFDLWRQQGCEGWGYDDVLPYFRKAETSQRGATPEHGDKGPLYVSRGRARNPICSAFIEAAVEAGHPASDDFNGPTQEGFGHFDCTIRNGRRWSTATAYLKPAKNRSNLRIVTKALAQRILVSDGRAIGVEALVDGELRTINASKEIILCGGAINTPQLLMLSGIGPAEHLSSHGIPVVLDRQDVGRNLQDHIAYKFHLACDLPVTAYKYLNPFHAILAGMNYVFRREGVISHTALPTGGFFRSKKYLDIPDIQVQVAIGLVPDYGRKLPDRHGFTVYVNQGRPLSRGEIRLQSASAQDRPLIDPRYFSDAQDMDTLIDGVEQVREMLKSSHLAPYISQELSPGPAIKGREAWDKEIRAKAVSTYHPVGTCRMGNDPGAVLDARLRVNGIKGLRVADASVMPTLINGNTNAPTIMIAEKAAAMIAADR